MSTAVLASVEVLHGRGVLARAGDLIAPDSRILLVASARARAESGIDHLLAGRELTHFSDFSPNPVLREALAAAALHVTLAPDVVIGLGGGSSLDVAKLARSLPPDSASALEALAGRQPPRADAARLLLMPTTAGSGSEVTSFATLYVQGVKASLDAPELRAQYTCVDPDLVESCPPHVAISSAMDAVCHAVESFLSPRSTAASRRLAVSALQLSLAAHARSGDRADLLARSATTAGLAIDTTRTALPHAFSYGTTVRHGIPHGTACALHLPWYLDLLASETVDERAGPLHERLQELAVIFECGVPELAETVHGWTVAAGCPPSLRAAGVPQCALPELVASALTSTRATNVPIPVAAPLVQALVGQWWDPPLRIGGLRNRDC